MRSEGILERFYAMFVFRLLSGRQIDPIANLGNRTAPSAFLTRTRVHAVLILGLDINPRLVVFSLFLPFFLLLLFFLSFVFSFAHVGLLSFGCA